MSSKNQEMNQESEQILPFIIKEGKKCDCVLEHDQAFKNKLKSSEKAYGKLMCVTFMCFFFMIVEIVGGYLSNSVAIMTDAAHMFSDVAGFGIGIISIQFGLRAPNRLNTYGYHRAEVLGALASIVIIWVLIIGLVYEASIRVNKIVNHGGYDMEPEIMIITATIGLCCNIINLIALGDCSCKEDEDDEEPLVQSITSVFKPNPLYYSIKQPKNKSKNIRLNDND